jgi:hypothetical protein
MGDVEEPLAGGWVSGVVRVGGTVRRRPPEPPDAVAFVEALLVDLEEGGYPAPRFLGRDEQGRQVLSFVEGYVPVMRRREDEPPAVFDDPSLVAVMALLRALHELTAQPDGRVALHGDPAPRNTVYRDDGWGLRPVVLIDWDQAHLGGRLDDVTYAMWQFLDIAGTEVRDDPPRAARRMRMMADAYGLGEGERLGVVAGVWTMMDLCWRGIERRAAAGNPAMQRLVEAGAADEVRAGHAWFHEHQDLFATVLR